MKKNNYSYIGIAFVILVFGILFIPKIVNRITNKDISRTESRTTTISSKTQNKKSDLEYLILNNTPKKVPPFSFTNQHGKTITNADYAGKVYLIEFFFTTCPTICPRMSRNLVHLQNAFPDTPNFGIASFTITPQIDTPEVLKKYAENYKVTNPNWNFLTGNQEKIYQLANQGLNLYTAKNVEIDGGFEHSGNFVLVDKEGYIRSRVVNGNPLIYYNGMISEEEQKDDEGNQQEISMLKEDIKKLLNE